MIDLHWLYVFAGAVFAGFALGSARDETNAKRHVITSAFKQLSAHLRFSASLGNSSLCGSAQSPA